MRGHSACYYGLVLPCLCVQKVNTMLRRESAKCAIEPCLTVTNGLVPSFLQPTEYSLNRWPLSPQNEDASSKQERLVDGGSLGKPEKPPSSGVALYENITAAIKLKDMDVAERNRTLGQSSSRPGMISIKRPVRL